MLFFLAQKSMACGVKGDELSREGIKLTNKA
jgi:hypothetical protein